MLQRGSLPVLSFRFLGTVGDNGNAVVVVIDSLLRLLNGRLGHKQSNAHDAVERFVCLLFSTSSTVVAP